MLCAVKSGFDSRMGIVKAKEENNILVTRVTILIF